MLRVEMKCIGTTPVFEVSNKVTGTITLVDRREYSIILYKPKASGTIDDYLCESCTITPVLRGGEPSREQYWAGMLWHKSGEPIDSIGTKECPVDSITIEGYFKTPATPKVKAAIKAKLARKGNSVHIPTGIKVIKG